MREAPEQPDAESFSYTSFGPVAIPELAQSKQSDRKTVARIEHRQSLQIFSGIGTIGAAHAPVNDFRGLEPLPKELYLPSASSKHLHQSRQTWRQPGEQDVPLAILRRRNEPHRTAHGNAPPRELLWVTVVDNLVVFALHTRPSIARLV